MDESDRNHLTTPGGKRYNHLRVSNRLAHYCTRTDQTDRESVRTPGAYAKPATKAHQPILLEREEPFCRQSGLDNTSSVPISHSAIRPGEYAADAAAIRATVGRLRQARSGPCALWSEAARCVSYRPGSNREATDPGRGPAVKVDGHSQRSPCKPADRALRQRAESQPASQAPGVITSFLCHVYCKQVDELRAMGNSQDHSHFPSTPGRSFA